MHAECEKISVKHLKVCPSYVVFNINMFHLCHMLITVIHEGKHHQLDYVLKDLEDIDYYCPDCKAKSNYALSHSDSEKWQPQVRCVSVTF